MPSGLTRGRFVSRNDRSDVSGQCRNALTRHSLETLHVQVLPGPGLCGLTPDLRGRAQPGLVIERPAPDEGHVRHDVDLDEYRRSAVGAEMPVCRLAAGALALEGLGLSLDLQGRTGHGDHDGKSASGLPLAVIAVTDRGHDWFGFGGIPYLAAEAAA